jgi:bifunctional non-homologous end joining protein LigD
VARANSTIATVNRSIKGRPRGTVYIDYLQNARGKAVVAPYSVRARPGAPVSAPLKWSEIKRGPQPAAFTIKTMPARLARTGDLFINVLTKPQALDDALQCLAQS